MKLPIIVFAIIFLCAVNNATSQCCAAGNPSVTGFHSGVCNENVLAVSLFYQYSFSDKYYKENQKSDFRYIDNSYYDFTSLMLNYGITEHINISADVGFFFDKTQYFDFGQDAKFDRKAQGIGDAAISLQYFLNVSDVNSFSIIPGFKTTLPVGQFDQKDGAVILPIDIQPSSGSFKYELGLSFIKGITDNLSVISANTFEISQRIETERTNYKYGNLYNSSLIGIYKLIQDLSVIMQVRAQYRDKSSDRDMKLIASTGGFVLFVVPQLSYNILHDLSINIQYELPVLKNMNGIQLTNNYAFGLRINKNFTFEQNFLLSSDEEIPNQNLNFKEIKVSGLCDMCKDRIEKVAKEFENVQSADWNVETKILKIGYEKEPDFDAIKKAIAKAGHDNETYTAKDEDYNRLNSCCKYRK